MAGVKGKSGKVTTPAQRQARREAAQAGGMAKAGRTSQAGGPAGEDIPAAPNAAFAVACWMDYKDYLACELQKRKILEADIVVETRATERDQARKKLFTVEQMQERDDRHNAAVRDSLLSAVGLVGKWVPADKIIAAQAAFREWADQQLEHVANQVKAK